MTHTARVRSFTILPTLSSWTEVLGKREKRLNLTNSIIPHFFLLHLWQLHQGTRLSHSALELSQDTPTLVLSMLTDIKHPVMSVLSPLLSNQMPQAAQNIWWYPAENLLVNNSDALQRLLLAKGEKKTFEERGEGHALPCSWLHTTGLSSTRNKLCKEPGTRRSCWTSHETSKKQETFCMNKKIPLSASITVVFGQSVLACIWTVIWCFNRAVLRSPATLSWSTCTLVESVIVA